MDAAIINPFITSTIETFTRMLGCQLTIGTAAVETNERSAYEIAGVIGLSGDAEGVLALSFSSAVALKVISRLIGADCQDVNMLVADGICELANIIAGNAKQYLNGTELLLGLPYVISGKGARIVCTKSVPVIIVPISSDVGEFGLELALRMKSGESSCGF
jgi:chemotaxis protein CheX